MKTDMLGREINIGDVVILYSVKSGNARSTSPDFSIGRVIDFTSQMVIITPKRLKRDLKYNLSDEGYESMPIRKYPEKLIVYSSKEKPNDFFRNV